MEGVQLSNPKEWHKELTDYSDVLVLIPALNEQSSIAETIKNVRSSLKNAKILVVDNGSSDDTVAIASKHANQVLSEAQRGKGFAVRRGFREIDSKISTIILIDGDATYSCENMPRAIEFIRAEGVDMVVGTRVPSQRDSSRKPVFKRGHNLGNAFFTRLSSLLHPVGIEDSLSGWRVMSRGFVQSFVGGATGFEIEAELNAHVYLIQGSVKNLAVKYYGRGEDSHSKLNTYRDGLKILKVNFALFRNNRPQIAFGLLAVPWFVSSAILNYRALSSYFSSGLVKQFPSLIAGVGTFIIGALLVMVGIVLQRIKLVRVSMAHYAYVRD
jgi:glycosyltransferase involved in cell wall biosynthesis